MNDGTIWGYIAFGIAWIAFWISIQHIRRFKKVEKQIEELKKLMTNQTNSQQEKGIL